MPKFSKRSVAELDTCNIWLIHLFDRVIQEYDCSIICGYRGVQRQNAAFEAGYSKVKYPYSKHNITKFFDFTGKRKDIPESDAVDAWPYPVPRNQDGSIDDNSPIWREFMFYVKGVAAGMEIEIRCGGEFSRTFKDYPHFELV